MEQIKTHIKFLYPLHMEETLKGIHGIIAHYKQLISSEEFQLSEDDVVLIAYADSFKHKNESSLQTLNKVCNKYLKESINSVHLLPFYPYTSDDGFSVVDYKKVDTDLGTWDDITELNKSFNLMFDAVINHMSKSSDWFTGFLNEEEEYAHFFIQEDPNNAQLSKVTRPRTSPLLHEFNKGGNKRFIWTTFSEDQIDLNYSNYRVFLSILDVLLFYVSKGAKLIRLDAIAFMWKKLGTNCLHLKETHHIIQAYRRIIEMLAPQTIIITETNVPHHENISYFGNGYNEAHMVYNFSLPPLLAYSLHTESVETLTLWASSLKLPSSKTCFFNFTASHDGIGVRPLQGIITDQEINMLAQKAELHGGYVSYKSNADGTRSPYELNCNYMDLLTPPAKANEERTQRFMLTQSVMLTIIGVPGIYYHSIFGSENDIQGVTDSGINRRINRQKIEFTQLEEEIIKDGGLRARVFEEYKKLLMTRKKEKAFNPTCEAKFKNDNGIFIIERKNENENIICIHNFTSEIKDINKYVANKSNLTAWKTNNGSLEPFGYLWLKS